MKYTINAWRFSVTSLLNITLEERLKQHRLPVLFGDEVYTKIIKQITNDDTDRYYISDVQFTDFKQAAEFALIVHHPGMMDRVSIRTDICLVRDKNDLDFASYVYSPGERLLELHNPPIAVESMDQYTGLRFILDRKQDFLHLVGILNSQNDVEWWGGEFTGTRKFYFEGSEMSEEEFAQIIHEKGQTYYICYTTDNAAEVRAYAGGRLPSGPSEDGYRRGR